MESNQSLMVILDREEYCYMYDADSVPDLLDTLLEQKSDPTNVPQGFFHLDQAREVARGLIGKIYQQL